MRFGTRSATAAGLTLVVLASAACTQDAPDPGLQAQTGQPAAEQPGTEQPGTEQPGSAQPGNEQPVAAQPGTAEPGIAQPGTAQPDTESQTTAAAAPVEPTPTRALADDFEPGTPLEFTRPDSVRGLYLNAWTAGSQGRLNRLIALADSTEINAFVIDIKDATGYVSHPSRLPAVREAGATGEQRIADLRGLLERLQAHDIYPIARIVVVKDPLLIAHRPELAVQDTAGGVWVDSKGFVWLNPWHDGVLAYHLDLAQEVAALGFPEIQWDYIRFPDAPQSDLLRAEFTGARGPRTDAIRSFLEQARGELDALGVRSTADVFGVTTTFRRDVGIGQVWESFIEVVDAALPMVYPSHYWTGSFGIEDPNAHPYEIVREAMEDAVQRSAALSTPGEIMPWLQDFSLGEPAYGPSEVRSQIQAVYDAGLDDWVLWNPGSRYTSAALRPATGWSPGAEPTLRIGDAFVAPAERFAALERTRRQRFVADSLANALELEAQPDTARSGSR